MKRKLICPECNKPQSRWESLEPFPGFSNQCANCGTDYKTGISLMISGLFFGLICAILYIMADGSIITWGVALGSMVILYLVGLYISPYYIKLKKIKDSNRNILKKWMFPLFRWQLLICIILIFSTITNNKMLKKNNDFGEINDAFESKIGKFNSVNELKGLVNNQYKMISSLINLYRLSIKFNLISDISVLILIAFNFLFYFKIRYLYKKII